jgi:membrane fusion protein, multidrug efflux system
LVDPATGAIAVRARIPNPDRRLLPGTYVTLVATLGMQPGVFAIPQAAVLRDARGAYVLVVGGDGKVARKDVRTASAQNGDWIVTDGLAEGDQVIVAGVQKVRVDAPATAVPWQRSAAQGAAAPAPPAAPDAPAAPAPAPAPASGDDADAAAPADTQAEG